MVLRRLTGLVTGLLLAIHTPAIASPEAQKAGEALLIPFEPPLGESVRYRWETSEEKDGRTKMSWSVDDYRFEEVKDGYRLVKHVSSGSNDEDPAKQEFSRRLEELTKLPFVLRLNEDAEIVELERSDEYWTKIIEALRAGLSKLEPKRPGQDKMIDAVVGLFEDMPGETRLAKLTEPIQPIVEFAWTETSVGQPIIAAIDTTSPLGPVKQEVAVTLTRVSDGFAHLTIRTSIPTAELKKLTASMFNRLNNGALKPDEIAKIKAQLDQAKNFDAVTVADYKVSIEDGMLESFHSTLNVSSGEGDKVERRSKTLSVKRVN
jgi:hypothetical protein